MAKWKRPNSLGEGASFANILRSHNHSQPQILHSPAQRPSADNPKLLVIEQDPNDQASIKYPNLFLPRSLVVKIETVTFEELSYSRK